MNKHGTILIVDDEHDILLSLKMLLKQHFEMVIGESNPYQIVRHLRSTQPDVILLDMNFKTGVNTGQEGLQWLAKIKEQAPATPVVMMTAYSGVNVAVQTLKNGAYDFIEKPWRNEKLIATVTAAYQYSLRGKKLEELEQSQEILSQTLDSDYVEIIGVSKVMKDIFKTVDKVAATDANVLILGENGTGKELIARSLHRKSGRAGEVFIPVDMGAISDSLFESELFGHKKGSFTGAHQDRIGRFQAASSGTLFLDEIGNLSLPSQAKLLQALQNRKIIPIGSNKAVPIDIRLISATNMPLYDMVDESTFRQDLLYRFNTVEIKLPALRERQEDITLLADHFLMQFRKKYRKPALEIHRLAYDKLMDYSWPGNIRELRHVIERSVIMSESDLVTPEEIVLSTNTKSKSTNSEGEMTMTLDQMEEQKVRETLRKHAGNISKTATELGLTRTSLYRRLEKYGI